MIPSVTLGQFESDCRDRHLLHAALDYHAAGTPHEAAIVNATRGTRLTWSELQQASILVAAELARMGFRRGNCLAASLPLLNEHIVLEYACFRLGVIHAPLDLRLSPAEVLRCLSLIEPKAFAFPGRTPLAAFSADSVLGARGVHLRRHELRRADGTRNSRARAVGFKPAGNQVFPGDVENHIALLADKVTNVGVVGHENRIWSEGILGHRFVGRGAEAVRTVVDVVHAAAALLDPRAGDDAAEPHGQSGFRKAVGDGA